MRHHMLGYRDSARLVTSAGRSARGHLDTIHNQFAALPKEEFPHTVELAAEMTEPDLDSRFEFAINRLLDGVAALRNGRPEPHS
jgi:TetR/AcrR family tetracycline transcriptional repressor